MKTVSALTTALCFVLLPAASRGALVYEGFDYGSTSAAMSGQAVSGSTVGLTGSYSGTPTGSASGTYVTSSLSFNSNFFSAQGGALTLSLSPSTSANEGLNLAVPLNAGTVTGTLYASMLFNLTERSTTLSGDALQMRIFSPPSSPRMIMAPESPNSGDNVAMSYSGSTSSQSGAGAITVGTTYLMVGRWTNVGVAGGGVATMWIMTSANYDSWLAAGATEAALDTNATFVVSQSSTNQTDFTSDMSLQFSIGEGGTTGTGTLTGIFDELRFDTTLGGVVAVPEPGAAGILGLAAGLGVLRRRRRQPLYSRQGRPAR